MTTICNNLVMFFLFLSLHASNARQFGLINREPTKNSILPHKGNGKSSVLVKVLDPSKSWSNELDPTAQIVHKAKGTNKKVQDEQYHKSSMSKKPTSSVARALLVKPHVASSSSNASQSESSLSFSWKLPHRKKGRRQPWNWIDLDYSPPKTHPPVHN